MPQQLGDVIVDRPDRRQGCRPSWGHREQCHRRPQSLYETRGRFR
jgi:hypothetical protein